MLPKGHGNRCAGMLYPLRRSRDWINGELQ
jgi:hypothetical protein